MFTRWVDLKKAKKCILLLGPRRSGKSTYLKANFKEYKYITLDDLDHLEASKKDPKGWVQSLGSKFIIDEAQRNPDLSIVLKWLIDEKKAHFILTGSTGINLFERSIETLAGRIQVFYMTPACFGEKDGPLMNFLDLKKDPLLSKIAIRELKPFLKSGGFPEILVSSEEEQIELFKIYKNSYFTRDVADINKIENLEGLRTLYAALIRGIGSRYEVSNLVRETGMSTITVKKYLNTLIQSGLLFKLYGYHLSEVKRYISKAKSYFIDVGILHSLSVDFSRGQLLESFVIAEFEKRRRLGLIQAEQLFYYESNGGKEIDLIIDEPQQVTAIEIKSSEVVSGRDLRSLAEFNLKKRKKIKKIVYYMGNEFVKKGEIELRPVWSLFRSF